MRSSTGQLYTGGAGVCVCVGGVCVCVCVCVRVCLRARACVCNSTPSGADRVVMSWELRSHAHTHVYVPSKRQFSSYTSEVLCAAVSPNQQLLATGSLDGCLHVWLLDERPDKPVQLRGVTGRFVGGGGGGRRGMGDEACVTHDV